MKKSFLIPILTLLFISCTIASSQWVTTQLTNNSYSDFDPQINDNGHVVWCGGDYPYEIFYYNGDTVTQLTDNTSGDRFPQINASGHVVWQSLDATNREIFYYDGTSVIQLTDNTPNGLNPQINDSGHVVWHGPGGSDSGRDYEIFYYDGSTVLQLTSNTRDDSDPQINASGHVVWSGDGSDEIFYYDGNTTTQLTDNYDDDTNPQINDSGHVVWESKSDSYGNRDAEIFYYDGSTVTQLTDNDYDDYSPKINNNGHAVWSGNDGTDNEIFYYDGNMVHRLTDNISIDSNPQINDSGLVVWEGYDGTDKEIFMAKFIGDMDGVEYLIDNCPSTFNPGQQDADTDGIGDACDSCPNDAENDIDNDGICADIDNCPNTENPGQQDVDNDGTGDVCDNDTVYGTISIGIQESITVNIYIFSCGVSQPHATVTTDAQGYYAIGGLENGRYIVAPEDSVCSFSPAGHWFDIPQSKVRSYSFLSAQDPLIFGLWFNSSDSNSAFLQQSFYGNGFHSMNLSVPGLPMPYLYFSGTYTICGNQITFRHPETCGAEKGTYTYSITNDGSRLDLVMISDPCTTRSQLLQGGYWIEE